MSVARNSIKITVTTAVVFVISFLANILVTRNLPVAEKGFVSLVFEVAAAFTVFGSLGLPNASVYFAGKKEAIGTLTGNMFAFYGVVSVLMMAAFYFTSDLLFKDSRSVIVFGYILIPLVFFSTLSMGLYHAKKLFNQYNFFTLLRPLAFFVFLAVFKVVDAFSITHVLISLVLSFLLVNLAEMFFLKDLHIKKLGISLKLLRKSIHFGLRGQVGNMIQYLNYRLNFFIIIIYLNPEQLAFYSIATVMAETLMFIPRAVSTAVFPRIAEEDSESEIKRLTEIACRTVLFLTAICGAGLLLIGNFIIPFLFTGPYVGSVKPLQFLVPGIIVLSISNILAQNLMGRNYPQYASYCSGVGFVALIICNFMFIPMLGISGAALASSIAYIASTIGFLYFYSRKTTFNFSNLLIIKKEDFRTIYSRLNFSDTAV